MLINKGNQKKHIYFNDKDWLKTTKNYNKQTARDIAVNQDRGDLVTIIDNWVNTIDNKKNKWFGTTQSVSVGPQLTSETSVKEVGGNKKKKTRRKNVNARSSRKINKCGVERAGATRHGAKQRRR